MMRCRMKFTCVLSFFSLALLSAMSLPPVTSAVVRCREAEREALLELKQRLVDPSNRLFSWVGEDCCAWQGVGCSNITARVIKLDLGNDINTLSSFMPDFEWEMLQLRGDINTPSLLSLQQLTHLDLSGNDFTGPIPAFVGSFGTLAYLDLSEAGFNGEVPDQLGNLSTLRHIDLSINAFTGPIPAFMGSFGKLTYLDLSQAGFIGKVPDQLGNLSTLRYLDLSYNSYDGNYYGGLTGSLYVENPGWIAHLTSLRHLNMSWVSFRRTSNWFETINALPHIEDLKLANCELVSFPRSPPHLNFTSLRTLNFQGNNINGTEPVWVYNLTTLESLYFGLNDIYWSSMHGSITRLASLKTLDLSRNIISKRFLLSLSNLCKLQILILWEITMKDELSNLEMASSGCLMQSLEELYLYNSQLNGSLLNWLGNMKKLKHINLRNSSLHGSILNSLGTLTSLQYLDLSYNNLNESYNSLHGSILNSLGTLTSLQYLDLSYNNLNESYNSHNGSILNSLGSLSSLQYLNLRHNNLIETYNSLHSSILNSLRSLSSLQYLDLSYNNLDGTYNSLHGSILNSLGSLTSLQYLDLSYNNLNETYNSHNGSILNSLGSLSSLQYLNLRHNNLIETYDSLHGSILNSLGSLASLQFLDLSYNNLNEHNSLHGGSILNSLGSLTSLQYLDLSCNNLNETYILNSLGSLTSLQYLDLSYNNLNETYNSHNGSILNSLGSLSSLQYLNLRHNNLIETYDSLHGSILNSLGSLASLQFLDLSYNNLNEHNSLHGGSILNSLGSLSSLQYLNLRHNNLNETIGESIRQLKNLISLDLSGNSLSLSLIHLDNLSSLKNLYISNNFLFTNETDDWIPTFQLQALDMSSCKLEPRLGFPKWLQSQKNLIYLNLDSVGIEGSFPTFLPSSLEVLYLSNNSFSSYLPQNIGNTHPNIKYLDLQLNNFNGSIPHSLCQMHNLMVLQLSKNNFSGELPNCWNSSSVAIQFDLSNNLFHGEIPHTFCSLQSIQSLSLRYNRLSGRIPLCLQNCRNLFILDVGYNNFIGNIPTWSEKSLPFLRSLNLNSNSLTGNIPELSHLVCLQTLDLSSNNLSGSIPKSFGNFSALKSLPKDTKNMYSLTFAIELWLRIKGIEYEYESLYGLVKSIDLSNNAVSGYIPEELGNLHGLQHLNLSKNNLIGEIPWNIKGMQYLEGLDLSRNSLSGKIPSTLAYLNFLEKLNLSYNNLWGSIPTGTQLQSFDPSTYIGNPYLCGPPLTKGCTSDIVKGIPELENKDGDGRKETIWLFTSIALGFIMGFWGIWSTLQLHKRWRIFYFCAIDNTFDKLYMKTLLKIRRKFS